MEKNAWDKGFLKKKDETNKRGDKSKKNAPHKHKILRKLVALGVSRLEDIPKGYESVKQEAMKYFSDCAQPFFLYYEKQWLSNPQSFCVYGLKDRTNNFLESYHKTLNSLLKKNPKIHHFLGKFNLLKK